MTDTTHAARLQLVVPCYNEAGRLSPAPFLAFVREHRDAALLFVDDGSTDGTPRVLAEIEAAGEGRVSRMALRRNSGKAVAVREGMLAAFDRGAALAGYWDSDLATPLSAVPRFLEVLDRHPGVDIVIGSRVKLMGRQIARSPLRHYVGRVFATAASLALGLAVYDTQCGAKIFRACEPVRRVFAAPFRSAWVFDVEILARYADAVGRSRAEAGVYELPLARWVDVPGSKVKPWHGVRAAWDLLRLASRPGRRGAAE